MQAVPPYGAYVMVQPPSGGIACRGFVMKSEASLHCDRFQAQLLIKFNWAIDSALGI